MWNKDADDRPPHYLVAVLDNVILFCRKDNHIMIFVLSEIAERRKTLCIMLAFSVTNPCFPTYSHCAGVLAQCGSADITGLDLSCTVSSLSWQWRIDVS